MADVKLFKERGGKPRGFIIEEILGGDYSTLKPRKDISDLSEAVIRHLHSLDVPGDMEEQSISVHLRGFSEKEVEGVKISFNAYATMGPYTFTYPETDRGNIFSSLFGYFFGRG